MNALTAQIQHRLQTKKFCMVFENDLERVWPRETMTPEERKRHIHNFAKRNNWEATIYDPGLRVSFRPLKS